MTYLYITIFLFLLIIIYFRIADKYNIVDKPNARSSHSVITIRGGGIIFPAAMITAFALGHASLLFTIAVVIVGLISFIDDIRPLHQLPRFLSHLIAILLVVYDLGLMEHYLIWLPVILIFSIGWVNAFNFMDGINGITVLYSIVCILTFAYLYRDSNNFSLLITMAISCGVFAFFNVRKRAKTFAGDVGSISMAVFLAYFLIKIIFETGQPGYLLFVSVYGIDAIVTILYRLKNKENIFQPHRSHLYQYMVNELKLPHVGVAVIYAVTQLAINVITICLMTYGYTSIWVFVAVGAVVAAIYWLFRVKILSSIEIQDAR